jgi:hypothetical protein
MEKKNPKPALSKEKMKDLNPIVAYNLVRTLRGRDASDEVVDQMIEDPARPWPKEVVVL